MTPAGIEPATFRFVIHLTTAPLRSPKHICIPEKRISSTPLRKVKTRIISISWYRTALHCQLILTSASFTARTFISWLSRKYELQGRIKTHRTDQISDLNRARRLPQLSQIKQTAQQNRHPAPLQILLEVQLYHVSTNRTQI